MNNITEEIFTIEKRAEDMVAEAYSKAKENEEAIKEKFLQTDKEILSRKTARINKIIKEEEARMSAAVKEEKEINDLQKRKLYEKYEQNKDKWTDEIFGDIKSKLCGGK